MYSLCWRDADHVARQETPEGDFKFSRETAERLRAEREHDLNAGLYRKTKGMVFEEFVRADLQSLANRRTAASVEDAQIAYRLFGRFLAEKRIQNLGYIELRDVQRFYDLRLSEVAVHTVNKNIRGLKAGFNRAVKLGYIRENPVKGVDLKRPPKIKVRRLDLAEIQRLRAACSDLQWRGLAELALTAALRRGELLNLWRREIDWENDLGRDEGIGSLRTLSP